jgi:anti-sigma regulatory factor (Ser/Thr protein kinase)
VAAASGDFRREIEALDEVFAFLQNFADNHDIDAKTAFYLDLVVEELFTNMVRHNTGGGTTIGITLDLADNLLQLELVDSDVDPFSPEHVEVPPVDAGIEERRPGGLGIHLVRKMVDDLDYDYLPEERQMRVHVTKRMES